MQPEPTTVDWVLDGWLARADNVFLGELARLPELGALLWPRIAAAYIERCLAPAVPADEHGLAAFDQVELPTAEQL